jgi:phenylacetic acid degradation operon negative regulatory protein
MTQPIPRPEISVAQIILLILAQTGRASFGQIVDHSLVRSLGAVRSENSFYTALSRLKRRRFVARTADRAYELTSTGEYAALKAYVRKEFTESEKKVLLPPKEWDGRWRVVLFDVPESKRPIRDYIRGVLKRYGFKEFQRSMWIYPYKLPPFISKLLADPQLRRYTRALTTYDIDYDEDLRRQFKLL